MIKLSNEARNLNWLVSNFVAGVPGVTQAAVVSLGANEERAGIDFSTLLVPVASISGTVVGPDGQPPRNAPHTSQSRQHCAGCASQTHHYAGSETHTAPQ